MGVVEMVLTGKVNTEIVGLINTLGGSAMGMSGKDAHLIHARKQIPRPGKPDLGLVGEVEAINAEVLEMLVDKNYIPVISPVGLGADGTSYNINADHVAAEIAVAVKASKLIFLNDVAGILDETGQLLSELTTTDLRGRLQDGKAVKGGMAVKSKAVLRALEGGVSAAGMHYPAERKMLIDNAQNKDAPDNVMDLLNKLPEKIYISPIDITKEIGKIE